MFRSAGAIISVCAESEEVAKTIVHSDTNIFKLLISLLGKKMKLHLKRQQQPLHKGFLRIMEKMVEKISMDDGDGRDNELLEFCQTVLERDRKFKERRRAEEISKKK